MDYSILYNKVLGGWIGKCAGGILGAPIEGFKCFNKIPYSDKLFDTNFANDDLDLQILWLDMILKKGSSVRESDFKEHWLNHVDFPWCEYGIATRNLKLGLDAPDSGKYSNDFWKAGMGSPIRSEIWGMVNPGMPERAAFYARIDSSLDHNGFSVQAEQYLSACAAIAFLENDIHKVLELGLDYIPSDSDCKYMIEEIMDWNDRYDFDVVAGKIKSKYGDADFTNAPMNVAFIILSLLHANNNFDFVIDALHLGHDSDCIVATAGALLGIVMGYDKIPEVWKKRVGNELLVSPEITGIYCPETITELSELTCKAAQSFGKTLGNTHLSFNSEQEDESLPGKAYTLHTQLKTLPKPYQKKNGSIELFYENLSTTDQEVLIELSSSVFQTQSIALTAKALSKVSSVIDLNFNTEAFNPEITSLPYTIKPTVNEQAGSPIEKGVPYHGSWLLLGPFIEDDIEMAKQNEDFPDHGLPSLPSVQYMNHDAIKKDYEFVNLPSIQKYLADKSIFDQAFHAAVVSPDSMTIELNNYFYGKGERTLYLYTEVTSPKEQKKWLVMGSTGNLTLWHNANQLYQSTEARRRWPMGHIVELDMASGKNTLLIRLDLTLDDFKFDIGLKEHNNKHPHQTQWETDLQFTILNTI